MAFKLYRPCFRKFKLEKLLYKVKDDVNSSCFQKDRLYRATRLLYNRSYKGLSFGMDCDSRSSIKFIHSGSTSYGKVVSYKLSDIGEGIVEVVIKEWTVKPGDKISQFDPICEVQSDKASVTISSRYDGVVKKLYYDIDEIAKVGAPLIDIELEEGGVVDEMQAAVPDAPSPVQSQMESSKSVESHLTEDNMEMKEKPQATPAVRRLAKENNIDLQKIKGSGRSGRVLKEDVLHYIDQLNTQEVIRKDEKSQSVMHQTFNDRGDKVQEITGIRKFMVKSMNAAWEVPHFSYCDEVNASELVAMKDDLRRLGDSKGVKITFMPFFIKAASLAFNKYPIINSLTDEKCEKITVKSSHNIGVAIDTPHGLIVPNIKNVQELNVLEIAKELNRLQSIAAKGQLGIEDLNGGTFTLSNIGIIGGTYTKPILVVPQVVIGAIGKIQVLPRYDKKKNLVETHVFNISWAADHRVLDGATVARFSNLWKLYVEHPELLLNI